MFFKRYLLMVAILVFVNARIYAIDIQKQISCQESATMFSDFPTKVGLLNLITGDMKSTNSNLNTLHLNAAGYNKKDGFIWGVDQISKNGTLIRVGVDDSGNYIGKKFKIANESFSSFVGDIDDNGHLYIKTGDKNSASVIIIDLDPTSPNYLKKIKSFDLSENLIIHDWAFNPINDFLYAVTKDSNKLYKINPQDGTVSFLGDTGMNETQNLGASFFDRNGNFYVYANKSGKIYKIDVAKSANASYFSTTDIVTRNDGAMCSDIELIKLEEFECKNEGIIFSSKEDDISTNANIIDLETSSYNFIKTFSDREINSIGYNVIDNFIYGIGTANKNNPNNQLVKVDKNYNTEVIEIDGLPQGNSVYALGDVDFSNRLYVSTIRSENSDVYDKVKNLIVINLDTKEVERITNLIFPKNMTKVDSADYAFNPIDSMLYTVDATLNQLIRINPNSGEVETLGDVGNIGNVYSVISFFDLNGNFLFMDNTKTTMYIINISNPDNIDTKATVYMDNLNLPRRGDGAKCAYSRLPKKKILGTFNIERTNSGVDTINSYKRNAWYTQIVGRDFDYSVLFYNKDLTAEKEISNIPVKIELINQDTNRTIYERYAYIPKDNPTSRVDVSLPIDDLAFLPATRKAIFRISYGVDVNNSIIQKECKNDFKSCYELNTKDYTKVDYAKDNFAIRPETFYVTVHDKNSTLRNSRDIKQNKNAIRLASGYDYNLTVVATQYNSNNLVIPSPNYNTTIDRWLRFKTVGVCANGEDNRTDEVFKDGNNTTNLMELNNVGNYSLEIEDSNWTYVDQNLTNPNLAGCLSGNNLYTNKPDADGKVGCNIVTQSSDINISFQPYKFKVTLKMEKNNIPNSSHSDFLYMMNNINSTNGDVAIQFEGDITAQSKDNIDTTNFTKGCVANDVNLSLIAQTLSEDGINQIIRTSPSSSRTRSDVNLSRIIRYNYDNDNKNLDINRSLVHIDSDIIIDKTKFLNDNNGTTHLQIRYNLNKNSSETINPVQITFNSFKVNSTDSFSEANLSTSKTNIYSVKFYYPKGDNDLKNSIRNFYFAQVAPDTIRYPMVNCKEQNSIPTPINVDIFCDKNISYCTQTGIISHTQALSSPRASQGWYISIDHNKNFDGGVLNLIHTNSIRTIPNPDPISLLKFRQGRNGLLQTKFVAETKEKISILPSNSLLYNPNPLKYGQPEYEVSCSNSYKGAKWTGIGKTGNILNLNPNITKSHKMDW